jgi:hypothetical protein
MKTSRRVRHGSLPLGIIVLLFMHSTAADSFQARRNEFGQPDLSGSWAYASLTFFERPEGFEELVVSAEQAQPFLNGFLGSIANLGDPDTLYSGTDALMQVDGEYRSSIIVSPADGQLPLTEKGEQVIAQARALKQTFAGPETRDLDERCIGSIGYPPLMSFILPIPTKIVQTADYVMLKTEDPTVSRIVRLADEHSVAGPRTLSGSSTARWERDALVITSSHFRDDEVLRLAIPSDYIIGPNATVTERFTPISESAIHYEFTVDDSDHYREPWSGEFTMHRIEDAHYEYSCHEGNYSMAGILLGGQRELADAEISPAAH